MDVKPKVLHNVEVASDIGSSLEKLQLIVDGMVKTQELMMNRIFNLERSQQQAPRPPYKGKFQRGGQGFKPKNDKEVPNTLAPHKHGRGETIVFPMQRITLGAGMPFEQWGS
jgi:hypothetical protein